MTTLAGEKCNRARLYVTKQFSLVSLCGPFISVPMENIRFGCALWSSNSVISFPRDTCVGRQMINFITL